MLFRNEPLINEATVSQHLGEPGRLCGTKPRICAVGSIVGAPAISDSFPLVPRSEWPDRISQMDREQSRLSDFILAQQKIPCLNQEQTLYCHGNSPCAAVMFMRAQQGLPFVLLSPASIAGPTVGFRNQGGYIADDLRQVTTVGCASQEFVPANQIGRAGFRDGWEQDAAKYRAREWWDLGSRTNRTFDVVMTLLFARIPVCTAHNWWGHAVTLTDPVMIARGRYGARGRNSWGSQYGANGFFVMEENYATPDEAYALRSIVQ